YYSDDNGLSWKASEAVPDNTDIITQEPGVVELKDGAVLMIIRASGGAQQLSFSKDKGQSWSHIEASNIPSPISPATIRRIPKTGDLLLVWNDNGASGPGYFKGARTPLTIAISKDEGKTWMRKKNIENDPDGWYCYTAVHFTRKRALLGYCAGSQSKKTHLSLTRINMMSVRELYK
ncbi:MAG TPA: sialidase family protein, partial [Flavitalea sp.]|nr:sialidase family protein [Flavitalea sp.]